jgi:hypothetical protein
VYTCTAKNIKFILEGKRHVVVIEWHQVTGSEGKSLTKDQRQTGGVKQELFLYHFGDFL